MKPKKDNGLGKELVGAFGLLTQLGLSMAVAIGIGVFLGHRLDQWLGTTPWFLLGGSLLGGAAAIRNLYHTVSMRWKDDETK